MDLQDVYRGNMESSRRVYDSSQSDALKISVSSSLSPSPLVFAGCWILNAVAKLDRNGLGWCPRQATPWERKQKHPEIMSKFTARTKVDRVVLILTLREKLRNLAERCPREIEWNVKRVKRNCPPPLPPLSDSENVYEFSDRFVLRCQGTLQRPRNKLIRRNLFLPLTQFSENSSIEPLKFAQITQDFRLFYIYGKTDFTRIIVNGGQYLDRRYWCKKY